MELIKPVSEFNSEDLLAAYRSSPLQPVTIRSDHPALGGPDALLQMVVFSDFQCPYCRDFAVQARHLEQHYSDELRLVFVHFPLGRACNPIMTRELHTQACQAARAAEAARLQGKFWDFHDALFQEDLRSGPEIFSEAAADIGLDLERFGQDLSSEAVRRRVTEDIQMGIELGVNSTPTVFLSRRHVPDIREAALEGLVRELFQK